MNLGGAPIFLIGYRGTGKTTVTRELAARLGYDWIDSDDLVEQRAGKTISAIFAADGEAAFRDRESAVIRELCGRRRAVVALGGGAVIREENRRLIVATGTVVWLRAGTDLILRRLATDPMTANRRPNLTEAAGRTEIETVLAERTPHYRECATLIVDTDDKTAAEVADEILTKL